MFVEKMTGFLRQTPVRNALLWVSIGLLSGILLWNGFMLSLNVTSTTEFCISCHSMKTYVYENYKQSIHYRNSKGLQAGCADCHVPRPLIAKLVRKTIALNDVYHTILGSIDTPKKFSTKKPHLDERVRARMRATDSRECRNCHHLEQMDLERQNAVARKQHQQAKQLRKTCIDCHQDIGHSPANTTTDNQNDLQSFSLE